MLFREAIDTTQLISSIYSLCRLRMFTCDTGFCRELSTRCVITRMTLSPPLPNLSTAAMLKAKRRLASGMPQLHTRSKKSVMDFQRLQNNCALPCQLNSPQTKLVCCAFVQLAPFPYRLPRVEGEVGGEQGENPRKPFWLMRYSQGDEVGWMTRPVRWRGTVPKQASLFFF